MDLTSQYVSYLICSCKLRTVRTAALELMRFVIERSCTYYNELIDERKVSKANILGENIFTETIYSESQKEINLKNISAGIYFVIVFDGEKQYIRKLIVAHD